MYARDGFDGQCMNGEERTTDTKEERKRGERRDERVRKNRNNH